MASRMAPRSLPLSPLGRDTLGSWAPARLVRHEAPDKNRAATRYSIVPVTKRPALGPPIPRAPLSLKVTNEVLASVVAYAVRSILRASRSPKVPNRLLANVRADIRARPSRRANRCATLGSSAPARFVRHKAPDKTVPPQDTSLLPVTKRPAAFPPIPRASLSLKVTNEVLASSVRFAIATARLH